jgi:hypothetical protein
VKKLFIFFTVFYFLHRFQLCIIFIYFFSLFFSVKKAFQKTKRICAIHLLLRPPTPPSKRKLVAVASLFLSLFLRLAAAPLLARAPPERAPAPAAGKTRMGWWASSRLVPNAASSSVKRDFGK